MLETLLEKDTELLIYLNNLGNKQWDSFWLVITNQFSWIPLFVFILALLFWKFHWKKVVLILVFITVLVTFSDQFTNFIRGVFERLRPCNNTVLKPLLRLHIYPQSYSFTSGHATTSTAFVCFIVWLLNSVSKYSKFLFLFPLFFAYSRIYLGVHYPLDIFFGAINGLLIGTVFYYVFLQVSKKVLS